MKIDFACKKISLEELFLCSFSINRKEYEILLLLMKNNGMTIKEITKKTGKDRSTIQKIIGNLVKKGLCMRHQINLKKGGYRYIYFVKDKDELKKRIKELMRNWCRSAEMVIDSW